ncbi:MAG: hypothetical protein D6775_11420 [Caldilineae bacterium]|nr:MAG: hypothetical protein D6775_11420 [Caldilineae bacterium]
MPQRFAQRKLPNSMRSSIVRLLVVTDVEPSSDIRRLDFVIIGAPKCGTTALAQYLSLHPEVSLPDPYYEPGFFCTDFSSPSFVRNPATYYRQLRTKPNAKVFGEKTVWYLSSHDAPQRIHENHPDVKVIVCLRDPVDAVYSMHRQQLLEGNEACKSLGRALDLEWKRRLGKAIPLGCSFAAGLQYRYHARFGTHLARWLTYFPKGRVMVIRREDLQANPRQTLTRLTKFLGLSSFDFVSPVTRRKNVEVRSQLLNRALTLASTYARPYRNTGVGKVLRTVKNIVGSRLNLSERPRPELGSALQRALREEFLMECELIERLVGVSLT